MSFIFNKFILRLWLLLTCSSNFIRSVKLSQSNCDHEALIKCFLWLSIIYIQKGNFNLASQCLKTCLTKSFQSNYQLLYLISSIELSNLNFIFGANIGLKKDEKNFLIIIQVIII